MRNRLSLYVLGLIGIVALALPASGFAERPTKNTVGTPFDIIHVGPDLNNGMAVPVVSGGG